ncbi:MAG: PspA/IM30 family protein [Pseudomonadota bacterium]
MLKTLRTLMRARSAEAEEALESTHAPRILAQHLRDAQIDLTRGRHALAQLVAQQKAEERRAAEALSEIDRREDEARKALDRGAETLAADLANRIVTLEDARERADKAGAALSARAQTLRERLSEGERRLSKLAADLRAAKAARMDISARLRLDEAALPAPPPLAEAEALARRLSESTEAAEDLLAATTTPTDESADLDARIAEAGIANATRSRRDAVLARLSPAGRKQPANAPTTNDDSTTAKGETS